MAASPPSMVTLGQRAVPLDVRRSPRARRLSLRIDPARDGVVLVLPPKAALEHGLAFLGRAEGWLLRRLDALPPRRPFADGAEIPVLGRAHRIRHQPLARRGVWLEDGVVNVSGAAEHLPRRVADFLRRQARETLTGEVRELAARLGGGRPLTGITLRDTRSRWGSCSAGGGLSFSWRLILAPPEVLRYVVAHEVAHLKEHNHGPRFWKVVAGLDPGFEAARGWLKRHGGELHRVG